MKVNLEKVANGLVKGTNNVLKVLAPVAEVYFVAKWFGYIPTSKKITVTKVVTPSYAEAVKAIVQRSTMLDSNINKALAELKTDATQEYYSAVISIAESNMLDSSKIKAITNLN